MQAPSLFGGPPDLTTLPNHESIPPMRSNQHVRHPGPLHPPAPFIPNSKQYLRSETKYVTQRSCVPVINPALPSHNLHRSVRNIRHTMNAPPQAFPPERNILDHQSSIFSPRNEHASLDTGIEEEENQFVNSDVFAELTLEDVKDIAGSGEAVAFRQVSSDHRNPAFFIRNPSLIYGLTQSGGAAFFQRACEIVGYEWPPRLLPL